MKNRKKVVTQFAYWKVCEDDFLSCAHMRTWDSFLYRELYNIKIKITFQISLVMCNDKCV